MAIRGGIAVRQGVVTTVKPDDSSGFWCGPYPAIIPGAVDRRPRLRRFASALPFAGLASLVAAPFHRQLRREVS